MKKNLIPKGVLHREKNDIPEEYGIGRKGIPVVRVQKSGGTTSRPILEKLAEIEKEELMFNKDVSKKIEDLAYQYHNNQDDRIALMLGRFVKDQVLHNTIDNTKKFIGKNKKGGYIKFKANAKQSSKR